VHYANIGELIAARQEAAKAVKKKHRTLFDRQVVPFKWENTSGYIPVKYVELVTDVLEGKRYPTVSCLKHLTIDSINCRLVELITIETFYIFYF